MTSKPLVSFAIWAYNHEEFIREAIQSALAQTYSPLEIVISDDCSQDKTFEIIQQEVQDYSGPHKIIMNRNETNMGLIPHTNKIMELCSGEFIVTASGDDISYPERTSRLVEVWKKDGASVVCSDANVIDSQGVSKCLYLQAKKAKLDWLTMATCGYAVLFGAGMAWSKDVFNVFGPLPDYLQNEDALIPFRGAILSSALLIGDPLFDYRMHEDNVNIWSRVAKSSDHKSAVQAFNAQMKRLILNYQGWEDALDFSKRQGLITNQKHFDLARRHIESWKKERQLEIEAIDLGIIFRFYLLSRNIKSLLRMKLKSVIRIIVLVISPALFLRIITRRGRKFVC